MEAIVVDGGSPPSAQIILSAIDKEKEGDCALLPEKGEGLQDTAARCPGEPPPPLRKPLNIYPPFSWFKATTATSCCASPLCLQSLPEHCLRLKKIGTIFLNTGASKTEPAPCRKPPRGWGGGGSPKQKGKKKVKRKKNNRNKKDFTNRKYFSYGQI